jgi:hypothetical protein
MMPVLGGLVMATIGYIISQMPTNTIENCSVVRDLSPYRIFTTTFLD